jgi:hypothetical protein
MRASGSIAAFGARNPRPEYPSFGSDQIPTPRPSRSRRPRIETFIRDILPAAKWFVATGIGARLGCGKSRWTPVRKPRLFKSCSASMIYRSTPGKERPMIELDAPIISRLSQDLILRHTF